MQLDLSEFSKELYAQCLLRRYSNDICETHDVIDSLSRLLTDTRQDHDRELKRLREVRTKDEMRAKLRTELKAELKAELKHEMRAELEVELMEQIRKGLAEAVSEETTHSDDESLFGTEEEEVEWESVEEEEAELESIEERSGEQAAT